MMTELTDAFVAIPGGIGTLDELFEAWSWNALGYHAKPFALLNVDGFWDGMIAFLDHVTDERLHVAGAARAIAGRGHDRRGDRPARRGDRGDRAENGLVIPRAALRWCGNEETNPGGSGMKYLIGIGGIALILAIAVLFSSNRQAGSACASSAPPSRCRPRSRSSCSTRPGGSPAIGDVGRRCRTLLGYANEGTRFLIGDALVRQPARRRISRSARCR